MIPTFLKKTKQKKTPTTLQTCVKPAFCFKTVEKKTTVVSQLLVHLEPTNCDLLISSDSDFISVLTLLDLRAAFDTIDHDLLLNRLRAVFGIRDTALAFFVSYLSGRKQIVSVVGREMEPSSLLYGVLQGSVLGSILFIKYTQPLSDIIKRHSVLHHMFADDTELYNSAPRSSTDSLFCNMQNCERCKEANHPQEAPTERRQD